MVRSDIDSPVAAAFVQVGRDSDGGNVMVYQPAKRLPLITDKRAVCQEDGVGICGRNLHESKVFRHRAPLLLSCLAHTTTGVYRSQTLSAFYPLANTARMCYRPTDIHQSKRFAGCNGNILTIGLRVDDGAQSSAVAQHLVTQERQVGKY